LKNQNLQEVTNVVAVAVVALVSGIITVNSWRSGNSNKPVCKALQSSQSLLPRKINKTQIAARLRLITAVVSFSFAISVAITGKVQGKKEWLSFALVLPIAIKFPFVDSVL